MMARARRIYILMIKVNKLFSLFSLLCFLNEMEKMFSVLISSYRNTSESLGELENCGNTRLWLVMPQHFSFFQTSTRVSITRWKHGACFLFLNYYMAYQIVHNMRNTQPCLLASKAFSYNRQKQEFEAQPC